MPTKPDRIRGTRSILGKPVHQDDKDLVQWMAEQGDGIEYNEACAESLTEAAANTKSRFVFHTSTHGGMTRLLIPAEAKAWACGTLTHLDLSKNCLAVLPDALYDCVKLESLNVSCNCLYGMSDRIQRLVKLQALELHHNLVEELPPGIGRLAALTTLTFKNNPLITPPQLILDQGLEAIQQFFRDGEADGFVENRDIKIMVLGLSEAGKTSLIKALKAPRVLHVEAKQARHNVTRDQLAFVLQEGKHDGRAYCKADDGKYLYFDSDTSRWCVAGELGSAKVVIYA
jgi:hypothetical protein